jgi:hypothetical protein
VRHFVKKSTGKNSMISGTRHQNENGPREVVIGSQTNSQNRLQDGCAYMDVGGEEVVKVLLVNERGKIKWERFYTS